MSNSLPCPQGSDAGNFGLASNAVCTFGVSAETLNQIITELRVVRAHLDVMNQGYLDAHPAAEVPRESVSFVLMDLEGRLERIEDVLGNFVAGPRS